MLVIDLLPGIVLLTTMGTAIALLLGLTSRRFINEDHSLVSEIDRLLPQTQCAQCGFPGCRPYAAAIANGEPINHCPPGGDRTIRDLAELLGRDIQKVDESFGKTGPSHITKIRETDCIGCTLCIQVCPVDAIIGARNQMHVVLENLCTGCDLCLSPCPVECIDLINCEFDEPDIKEFTSGSKLFTQTDCIRCGRCEDQCPQYLIPQELFWQRHSNSSMELLNLESCIECRKCDNVCPGNIPLTEIFTNTKKIIQSEEAARKKAAYSAARFSQRTSRLESITSDTKTRASDTDRAELLSRLRKQK